MKLLIYVLSFYQSVIIYTLVEQNGIEHFQIWFFLYLFTVHIFRVRTNESLFNLNIPEENGDQLCGCSCDEMSNGTTEQGCDTDPIFCEGGTLVTQCRPFSNDWHDRGFAEQCEQSRSNRTTEDSSGDYSDLTRPPFETPLDGPFYVSMLAINDSTP